jgi:hypothetical protein
MLQSACFAWSERAGLDALLDASLLIGFAPIDAPVVDPGVWA